MNVSNQVLTRASWEHIYHFGKAAGWQDGMTWVLDGNADEVSHWLFAYMTTRAQRSDLN